MDLDRWAPLLVSEVAELLADAPFAWWVAGGWAVDLHVGRATREHADVDVAVAHRDAQVLRDHLVAWDLHLADPPGTLTPWPAGEVPRPEVHDVWCRQDQGSPWSLQVMLDDTDGDDWVYRRDPRVRRRLDQLAGPASTPGRQVLAPEVQLLWKAKHHRPKDDADLSVVLPYLDRDQRTWLVGALSTAHPGHRWLEQLGD